VQSKQCQATIWHLERQEAELLAAVEKLETEKVRLESELPSLAGYSVGEKLKAVKQKPDECVAAIAEWEVLVVDLGLRVA